MTCGCHSHNGFVLRGGQLDLVDSIASAEVKGLTPGEQCVRVDTESSVSGLRRDETVDSMIDEQHRRFLDPQWVW